MHVEIADLDAPDVSALLSLHLHAAAQQAVTHALPPETLRRSDITVFCVRHETGALMGVCALKTINGSSGEIKSMRTHPDHLRKGVSKTLMLHIHDVARRRGMDEILLETHPTPDYAAARALYTGIGYQPCGPFGHYRDSPQSLFMRFDVSASDTPLHL